MERVLIVDGHNAIFAWPDLCNLHRGGSAAARALARRELVAMLQQYQDATDEHVVVVFDGKGLKTDREGGRDGEILVLYTI